MNDPLDHLRAMAPNDDPDFAQLHDRIAHRIGTGNPGSITRHRRLGIAGGGLGGAACVGVALTLVLNTGTNDPRLPVPTITDSVVPDSNRPSRGAIAAESAAWYVSKATEAVEDQEAVLQIDQTYGVQHPGESMGTSVTREYLTSDGSASRWINIKEMDGYIGRSGVGQEDDKYVNPDGPRGAMHYYWVDPQAGVYTVFDWNALDNPDDLGTVQEQNLDYVTKLRGTLSSLTEWAERTDATVATPEESQVNGKPATCLAYTTDQPDMIGPDGEPLQVAGLPVIKWSARYCFDASSHLPVLVEDTREYQLPELDKRSLAQDSTTYIWHEPTPENKKLLEPGIDGLRKVDERTYNSLTN